ncbi:AbgT family transporter [Brevundimonas sp. 2R-24]|uniref:AbgT family transporter n=1 Tax=Peiella sedimenti TaxID=3061083 RepID=A0ABT8SJJ2_9CAUL|nr:AbgT family transporter [Caulobacteraceae bacterium XZ-24]
MGIGNWLLNGVEKAGNRLPDPVFIFVWLILGLMGFSVFAAAQGWQAVNPITGDVIRAQSLFAGENLRRLFEDMPDTLTGFAPLGYVLVVMLGAGVAERTGLFSSAMKAGVSKAPRGLLTPIVIFVAIVANHAADAAYVVLIPLAAAIYAAAGRHPIAGVAASFAGVSGGFSANIFPGQLDALLLGLTEPAAQLVDPSFSVNIAGNWWFITGMTLLFVPVGWWVTDKIVEPRLGVWTPIPGAPIEDAEKPLEPRERAGLFWALGAALLVIGLFAWLVLSPSAPLIDPEGETPAARLQPFYHSLVAAFFLLFLLTGVAYGMAARTIRSHRDIVRMTSQAMADMGPYIVLAFVAAHFVALFNWSGLGPIMAVAGAEQIRLLSGIEPGSTEPIGAAQLFVLLVSIVIVAALVNIFVGSASAKWAFLAPILVPMLMLVGVSPYMTTAAYRMGDSVTNIITPLMVYFPLILTFAQRWVKDFGLGSLMAVMLPYSLAFGVTGAILTGAWAALQLPLGPGEAVRYQAPPAAVAAQPEALTGPSAPVQAATPLPQGRPAPQG